MANQEKIKAMKKLKELRFSRADSCRAMLRLPSLSHISSRGIDVVGPMRLQRLSLDLRRQSLVLPCFTCQNSVFRSWYLQRPVFDPY